LSPPYRPSPARPLPPPVPRPLAVPLPVRLRPDAASVQSCSASVVSHHRGGLLRSVRRRFVAPCCRWRFAAFRTDQSAGFYSADGHPWSPRRVSYPPKNSPRLQPYRVATALAFLPFSPDLSSSCSGACARARVPSRSHPIPSRRTGAFGYRSRVRAVVRPCGRRRSGASASGSCAPPHPGVRCGRTSADPIAGIPDAAARRCTGADRLPDLRWVLCVATWAASMRRTSAPCWSWAN
jgi:hypothetical protein